MLPDDLSRHVLEGLCGRKGGQQEKEGGTTVWEGQEGGREERRDYEVERARGKGRSKGGRN